MKKTVAIEGITQYEARRKIIQEEKLDNHKEGLGINKNFEERRWSNIMKFGKTNPSEIDNTRCLLQQGGHDNRMEKILE